MAGNEIQVLGAELERVSPKVPTLFDRDDVFYAQIDKRPVEVISSRDMRIPLEIRPGGKFGYYDPDGGDLGRGDMPTYDKAVINSVHLKHAVEFTSKTVWSTDQNRKAVIDAFKSNLASAMKEFRRNVDGQMMGDGTGILGTITSVTTANNVDTYTFTTDGFGAKLMRYGQDINLYNSALTVCRTSGPGESTITFYDLANKTISVTPSIPGATAGDLVYPSGIQMIPPVAMLGVKYHNSNASTGTWLGFDRSINPEIRGNRVNGNGSALTLPLPRLALNKVGDRLGISARGAKRRCAWTHPAQQQAYEELGFNASIINKSAKDENLDLYFGENMQMAGAPIKTSYSWDRTRIDFNDMDIWGRAELHPAGFYQNPDNKQRVWEIRGASGGIATAWIFYIVASFNTFVNNPAGTTYIDNLGVPAGY